MFTLCLWSTIGQRTIGYWPPVTCTYSVSLWITPKRQLRSHEFQIDNNALIYIHLMLDQNNTDVVAHPHVGSPGSQKCNGYSNSFAIHPSWTQQELHQLKLTQKIWRLDTKFSQSSQSNGHCWKCSQELGNFPTKYRGACDYPSMFYRPK